MNRWIAIACAVLLVVTVGLGIDNLRLRADNLRFEVRDTDHRMARILSDAHIRIRKQLEHHYLTQIFWHQQPDHPSWCSQEAHKIHDAWAWLYEANEDPHTVAAEAFRDVLQGISEAP